MNPLVSGKFFCFTGTLQAYTRDEALERLIKSGGKYTSGVTQKCDYLVCGLNPGSKKTKAENMGIKTISEKQFNHMTAQEYISPELLELIRIALEKLVRFGVNIPEIPPNISPQLILGANELKLDVNGNLLIDGISYGPAIKEVDTVYHIPQVIKKMPLLKLGKPEPAFSGGLDLNTDYTALAKTKATPVVNAEPRTNATTKRRFMLVGDD